MNANAASPVAGVFPVELKGVSTRFGRTWVHRNIDLAVPAGEVVALVGGSGSGKTTLLRQMVGLLQPAAGEAPFFNAPVAVASSVQRQDVRADAARHLPAAGEMNAQMAPAAASSVTRAQVREATRDAMAHGYRVAAGEAA